MSDKVCHQFIASDARESGFTASEIVKQYILKVNRGDEAFPLSAEEPLSPGDTLRRGDGIAAPRRRTLIRRREKKEIHRQTSLSSGA